MSFILLSDNVHKIELDYAQTESEVMVVPTLGKKSRLRSRVCHSTTTLY